VNWSDPMHISQISGDANVKTNKMKSER
jgi:hypothetical protein